MFRNCYMLDARCWWANPSVCLHTSLYVIDLYYRFFVWVPAMFRPCCIHQIQAMFRSCCIHQIVQHLCDQTIYSTRAYFEQGHAAVSATIQIQHKSEIQNWIQILATRFQTHLAPTDAQETYLQASIKTSLFPSINWSCKLAIVPWWCSGALVITETYLHIQRFHWLTEC